MLAVLSLFCFASIILLCLLFRSKYCVSLTSSISESKELLVTKMKRSVQKRSVQKRSAAILESMPAKMQEDSLLFNMMPGEIRDRIFQYAVTEHAFRKQEYEKNAHYYRPGFRFADQKIDTALLRTCRWVYQETKHLPSRNYIQVEWCHRPPPSMDTRRPRLSVFSAGGPNMKDLKSLHLFTQQYWLEDWADSRSDAIAKKMPNLQYLKITLRHGDWWSWEHSAPLKFDPKQRGTANMKRQSEADDQFHQSSWGHQTQKLPNLRVLELELESIEGKRIELDDIVRRAPGWRFPKTEDQALILNPEETKRTGRIGLKLPGGFHVPNDPIKAKERLVKDGVDFTIADGEPEITGSAEDCLTYYIVTLVFEARKLDIRKE